MEEHGTCAGAAALWQEDSMKKKGRITGMEKKEGADYFIKAARRMLTAAVFAVLLFAGVVPAAAKEPEIIEVGMFRYKMEEGTGNLTLIGYVPEKEESVLSIPAQVVYNGQVHMVTDIKIYWQDYGDETEQERNRAVRDIVIPASVTGEVTGLTNVFRELEYVELKGSVPPEIVSTELPGPIFIVPKGKEAAYREVMETIFYYWRYTDLTEKDIWMEPDIAVSRDEKIERNCFVEDGLYLQVTKKAGEGIGEVSLLGIRGELETFYELPGIIEHDGYRYELTELTGASLYYSGAKVLVLPDTVTKMESSVFGPDLEVLFLSKNCPVIPNGLILSEPGICGLRYVHVPDGVEKIKNRAFLYGNRNTGKIRLPEGIEIEGEDTLRCFEEIIYGEAADGADENTELLTADKEVTVGMLDETKLTSGLFGGSAEPVMWVSSDPDLFEISDDGAINPKRSGTAYAAAYTDQSGLYGIVKVRIKGKLIGKGIFTYRITNAAEGTVTLTKINPSASTKTVKIPETVTYMGKKYTVTAAVFDEENPNLPMINGANAKDNRIETIIFPPTITGTVGYLGEMNEIRTIELEGDKAPQKVIGWMNDGGLLASQAVIRVPEKSVRDYKSSVRYGQYDKDKYGEWLEFRIEAADKK